MLGAPTPNIDRNCNEGAILTDAYAQASCTAGRAAFVGSLLYIVLLELPISPLVTIWIPVIAVFAIRVLSVTYGWGLPTFQVSKKQAGET